MELELAVLWGSAGAPGRGGGGAPGGGLPDALGGGGRVQGRRKRPRLPPRQGTGCFSPARCSAEMLSEMLSESVSRAPIWTSSY